MTWTRKAGWYVAGTVFAWTVALALRSPQLLVAATVFSAAVVLAALRLHRVRVEATKQISGDRVFEEQEVAAEVRLTNNGRRTGILEVQDHLPANMRIAEGQNHTLLDLRRGESRDLQYVFEPHVRGHYDLGQVRIRTMDAFALRAEETRLEVPVGSFTVYPKNEPVSDVRIRSRLPKVFLGENPVRQPGSGSEFYNLREFQAGDQLKDVNWKASVRLSTGREGLQLHVNHKERVSIADTTILFDTRAATAIGLETRSPATLGARAAATFARHLMQRRDRVGLAIYGKDVDWLPHGSGDHHMYTILSKLAGAKAAGEQAMIEAVRAILPRLSTKSPVVIVSPLTDDETVLEAVSTLRAHGMVVSIIVVNTPDVCFEQGTLSKEAHRVQRARHRLLLAEMRSLGASAYDWTPERSLDAVLARGDA